MNNILGLLPLLNTSDTGSVLLFTGTHWDWSESCVGCLLIAEHSSFAFLLQNILHKMMDLKPTIQNYEFTKEINWKGMWKNIFAWFANKLSFYDVMVMAILSSLILLYV